MPRSLTQWEYHRLRADSRVWLSYGSIWEYPVAVHLDAGVTGVLAVHTADKDALLSAVDVELRTDSILLAEFYVGGTVGPGTPIVPQPLNHSVQKPQPFVSAEAGGVVTEVGTLLSQVVFTADRSLSEGIGFIFAPDTGYYFQFTNQIPLDVMWSASWDYTNAGGNPAFGEARQDNNGRKIRFSYQDEGETDRTAQLQAVDVGATISVGTMLWTVTGSQLDIGWQTFDVTPQTTWGTTGIQLFTFQDGTPQPLDFGFALSATQLPDGEFV